MSHTIQGVALFVIALLPGSLFVWGFERNEAGWVRCRLTDGQWLVGLYATVDGRQPHASTYPNDKDLYLPRMVGVDQSTGRIHTDDQGNPIYAGGGVLIRWSEIKYLEFVHHDAGETQRAQ